MKQVLIALSALAIGAVFSLFWQPSLSVKAVNSGAIWTTNGTCGSSQQDVNHFAKGDHVYINGAGFDDSQQLDWYIEGQPGNASCDPNIKVAQSSVTADGSGAFCFDAYTVANGDCGEYQVKVGNKGDNYRVDDDTQPTATPTPTPTATSTPTPTPTTPVRVTPTATPTPSISVSKIRKTFMCYDQELGAYWRIRNDGNVVSGTITWKINQSSLTDIGTLNPGEAIFFYTKECGVLTVYENGVSKGTATCNTDKICEATPTPTPTVEVTPTVTPTPGEGLVAGLGYEVPCEKDEVSAKYHVTDNGQPVEGVTVTFDYNGHKKDATTNSDGYAIAVFGKDGENMLTATADGFNKVESKVQFPECPATSGGEVLGATTEMKGQVLGYATTGVTGDLVMQLSGVLGTLMVSAGALMHAKQK